MKLIKLFMKHPVAANLLMAMMLLSGLYSLSHINIQFLPNFTINNITVVINWPGASAEEVENSLLIPLEKELRSIEQLKEMKGTARQSSMSLVLEFFEGSDMTIALDKVREYVSRIRNLPQDSEKPIITRIEPYENIANLLIYGPSDLTELKGLAYQFERELLEAGIGKIEILGLPQTQININIKPETIAYYKKSLPQIAQLIKQSNQDVPGGQIGESQHGEIVKIQQKQTDILDIERIPLFTSSSGQLITVGDIAHINEGVEKSGVRLFHNDKPAVELKLFRAQSDNSLKSARLIHQWYQQKSKQLSPNIHLSLYKQSWQLIKQRIELLVFNGATGLLLIIVILFIILNRQIAFWITLGIPTSVLASIWLLSLAGGTINMVSLFAFILTFGIIVDDAIVIGEETLTNLSHFDSRQTAIFNACKKMLPAIFSSSLTTICAFFPLLFISGIIGTILYDIPLVVICVIVASLVECFLVLPGHLYHALSKKHSPPSDINKSINSSFQHFKDNHYRRFISSCIQHRLFVIAMTLSIGFVAIAAVASGVIKFTFFPSPDSQIVKALVEFIPGTPEKKRIEFLQKLELTAKQTAKSIARKTQGSTVILNQYSMLNRSDINNAAKNTGENYSSHVVELVDSESRSFDNFYFMRQWRKQIKLTDYIENLSITSPRGGPPGKDIDILISSESIKDIKQVISMIESALRNYPGVLAINDTLPNNRQHWLFDINHYGLSLGLTSENIGRQVRAAFTGEIVQLFYTKNEEIEIEVKLDKNSRENLQTLYHLPIITPSGKSIPLNSLVSFKFETSPEALLHTNGKTTAHITAEVDNLIANTNVILSELQQGILKEIEQQYPVSISLKGKSEEQQETFSDIKLGVLLALGLIYIILAWVFKSYSQPLIVMIAIPLGLIGAIFGHWVMGLNLTLLSIFGLFGLSGIVINDSIILLNEYNLFRGQRMSIHQAITLASSKRLRAVLLTSITTIAGLTPLLFERSLQAQFLIPMATSITFGLAFATLLILIVIPALLYILESIKLLYLFPNQKKY